MSPQSCTVCGHPERRRIDAALLSGEESNRAVARRFEVSEAATRRHKDNHLEGDSDEMRDILSRRREESGEQPDWLAQRTGELYDEMEARLEEIYAQAKELLLQERQQLGEYVEQRRKHVDTVRNAEVEIESLEAESEALSRRYGRASLASDEGERGRLKKQHDDTKRQLKEAQARRDKASKALEDDPGELATAREAHALGQTLVLRFGRNSTLLSNLLMQRERQLMEQVEQLARPLYREYVERGGEPDLRYHHRARWDRQQDFLHREYVSEAELLADGAPPLAPIEDDEKQVVNG